MRAHTKKVRLSVEECSSIQSFFMLHSLGGGTGSGFGSKILESLEDTFPKITRFACSVFPNDDDDVITSPYNALLSASKLIEHADCVFPVDNQALIDICNHIDANKKKTASRGGFRSSRVRRQDQQSVTGPDQQTGKGDTYHKMNGIAANMLLDLTASVRFEGTLNMDLSELPMNVVPYQRMHFLSCGMAPLFPPQQTLDISRNPGSQRALADMDKSFGSAHSSPINQLMRSPVPAKSSTYLASAILTRGQGIRVSDLERNVKKLQSQVNMVYWNTEGFKVSFDVFFWHRSPCRPESEGRADHRVSPSVYAATKRNGRAGQHVLKAPEEHALFCPFCVEQLLLPAHPVRDARQVQQALQGQGLRAALRGLRDVQDGL